MPLIKFREGEQWYLTWAAEVTGWEDGQEVKAVLPVAVITSIERDREKHGKNVRVRRARTAP